MTPYAVSGWRQNWTRLSCRTHRCGRLVARTLVSFMFSICTVTPSAVAVFVGAVRPAQRAEAGYESCHNFAALFEHCESHIARSHRVTVTLHENLSCSSSCCRTACTTHNSPACDTGVHDATRVIRLCRNSGNSFDSRGDTEAGGQTLPCTWGNKGTEYEYSERGQAFCCV